MSNFTPIVTGAPRNASIINAPLYQLDTAIIALQSLPSSTAALEAIIGNMAAASTASKIVVGAINELFASINANDVSLVDLFASLGDVDTLLTTSHIIVPAINELKEINDQLIAYIDSLFILVANAGGGNVIDKLREWGMSESYQMTAITYHVAYTSVVNSATVIWPDGSVGVFTTTQINPTWRAIDAYTITHVNSGYTVVQSPVTRNASGNITAQSSIFVRLT